MGEFVSTACTQLRRVGGGIVLSLLQAACAAPAEKPAAPALEPVPGRAPAVSDVDACVPRLRDAIRAGLERTHPNYSRYRSTAVATEVATPFDGSLDWHSNVHAHWALLGIARTRDDPELEALLLSRLTPAALARERAVLAAFEPAGPQWLTAEPRPYTFPYDQAWLLLLLSELELHLDPLPGDVRAFRLEVEARLLDWLESRPFPETFAAAGLGEPGPSWLLETGPSAEPANPSFIGAYHSWIFTWLAVALSGPLTAGAETRLATLRAERIEPSKPALQAYRSRSRQDFFWLPSLFLLVDDVSDADADLAWFEVPQEDLPVAVTVRSAHAFGVEVSKLWGLAVLAARDDPEARAMFTRRLGRIVEQKLLEARAVYGFFRANRQVPSISTRPLP